MGLLSNTLLSIYCTSKSSNRAWFQPLPSPAYRLLLARPPNGLTRPVSLSQTTLPDFFGSGTRAPRKPRSFINFLMLAALTTMKPV